MNAFSAVAAALLFAIPAAAAAQTADVTVVRQPDAAVQLAGTAVVIRAGLDRETPRQNGVAALVAQSVVDTAVSGVPLTRAIDALGGTVDYTVEAHDVRFYLEGLPAHYPAMLADLQSALAHPDFTPQAMAKARARVERREAEAQAAAPSVGLQMVEPALYAESDAALPAFGLPAIVARLSSADATAFYRRAYRRGGAVVSIAGDLAAIPGDSYAHVLDGLPPGESRPVVLHQPRVNVTSREAITHRDIAVPWLVAQYEAPPLRSKDFGPMLVLSSFMQRTLGDVASPGGGAAVLPSNVGAIYRFAEQPASMVILVDGGQADPTRSFATALTVVGVIGHAKLGGDLSEMKAYAQGRFLAGTQTLEDRAWLGAVFAENGITGDYVAHTLAAIDGTTAADLQRVAARYLKSPAIALVLPRTIAPGVTAP